MDALRGMLLGQCVLLTVETLSSKETSGYHAVDFTSTAIQLVGGGCQTILSYPPFSNPSSTFYFEQSQASIPVSTSLSYTSSLITSVPLLMSPSQLGNSAQPLSTTNHVKIDQHSPSNFEDNSERSSYIENTPELFSQCAMDDSMKKDYNAVPLHSTPLLRHSKHHPPKNLVLTPELL